MTLFDQFIRDEVSIDGTDIAYVMAGSGPPLLLLHGFPQCKAMWAQVAPQLSRHFTVVCADLRGYGDSAKPQALADHSNYSFRAMAADQVGLMNHLGFERFHLVGHDRGARTAHRLALDHPATVSTLTLMDIVPTYTMFMATNRKVASAYWHWYFLAQPAPFPERLIGYDPDYFYETCLVGWGAAKIADFDQEMVAEYRRAWRDPAMIRGSCSDYRAAGAVDLILDTADLNRRVTSPTLILFGAAGYMAQLYDIPGEWSSRCEQMSHASLPGGHFFVDQFPFQTAELVLDFVQRHPV